MIATGAYENVVAHIADAKKFGSCMKQSVAQSACYALGYLHSGESLPLLIDAHPISHPPITLRPPKTTVSRPGRDIPPE